MDTHPYINTTLMYRWSNNGYSTGQDMVRSCTYRLPSHEEGVALENYPFSGS